ncbi:membrane protein involved in the export of O-antigen and teichoic acid [Thiorhodovibrio frisius]|uniref:Membrane protein involved in the export of O-antigen and teichoic acid n=2 Tax=Thiorhodovibrio frisius TaxID=631362 RepID=H8YYD8_9GAMM|nr:membrane protein involved in the export of O-antigen and teichoic acid [Thiorhodovibrio frisius]WPL23451.1 stage V sporulation protein B [Thiorhodovibrio frisius]
MLSGMVVHGALARLLTPEEYGNYLLILSLALFLGLLGQVGLKQAVLRWVADYSSKKQYHCINRVIAFAGKIVFIASLVLALLWVFLIDDVVTHLFFSSLSEVDLSVVMPVWIALMAFRLVIIEIYRGLGDIFKATLFDSVFTNVVLMAALVILMILYSSLTLAFILFLVLGVYAINFLVSAVLLPVPLSTSGQGSDSVDVDHDDKPSLMSAAMVLYVTDLSVFALAQSMIWLVGNLMGSENVALFAAAQKLVNLVAMPLLIVNLVIPPFISELKATGDHERTEKIVRGISSLVGLPALIVLTVFVFFGDLAMTIVYGKEYASASSVLLMLSIGALANVLTGSCGKILLMYGYHNILMKITFSSGLISVLFGVVLIQYFGILGAAIAASLAKLIHNLLSLFYAHKYCGIWTHVSVLHFMFAYKSLRRL